MKYTLLEMTQDILSNLSSDEVNSISDTTESLQVATIIKQKYFDIVNRVPLPEHEQLVHLDPSLDALMPVLMYVPDGIANIKWLKYFNSNILDSVGSTSEHDINTDIEPPWSTTSVTSNTIALGAHTFTVEAGLTAEAGDDVFIVSGVNTMSGTVTSYAGTTLIVDITEISGSGTYTAWVITQNDGQVAPPGYQYVTILPQTQFIDMVNTFNPQEDNVESFTFEDTSNDYDGNFTFYFKNDRQPMYCTIISNYYVIFDSFDNTQDSTLQSSKTMAWGRIIPFWSNTDDYIPNLSEEQFQLLLNEAKALAFYELKQQPHALAMQEAKRGWSNVQKNKAVANRPTYFNELPNFGRRSGVYYGTRGFGNSYNQGWNQWQ
jgi:hypothetical protein